MNIGICDDNQNICMQISGIVKEYSLEKKEPMTIKEFSSGEEVYEYIIEGNHLDLLFLDIEMKELSGIELGVKLRSEIGNQDLQIVYVSGQEKYAMELFQVRPLNFLIKPVEKEKIFSMIDKAIELTANCAYFSYKISNNIYKIKVSDILYMESQGRLINMVTTSKKIAFYGKIKDVYEYLEQYGFITIHKSIIINYFHVMEFHYDHVIMSNNDLLTISQSQRKAVRSFQQQYEKGML